MTYTNRHELLSAGLVGDGRVDLPDYIRNNRYVVGMDKNNGQAFEDNLCFFRCLAMRLDCLCDLGDTSEPGKRRRRCMCKVQGVKNSRVLGLYEWFRHHTRQEVSSSNFGGVTYSDLARAEKCFDLRVTVLALQPDGLCTVARRSERSSGTELFLNEYEGHFSLVTDPDVFTQSFLCTQCLRRFTRLYSSIVHRCIGSVEIRRKFVGGAWEPQPSVFERLRSLGLSVPDMVYPYRITYDIECLLSREQLPEGTNKVTYTNRHEPDTRAPPPLFVLPTLADYVKHRLAAR